MTEPRTQARLFRMKSLLALPVAALRADAAARRLPPYHAVGTEPFWNLLIDEHDITFTQPDAQPIRQPTPQVIIGIAGEIYQTPRIDVNIVHAQLQRRHERPHLSRQGPGHRRRPPLQRLRRALKSQRSRPMGSSSAPHFRAVQETCDVASSECSQCS